MSAEALSDLPSATDFLAYWHRVRTRIDAELTRSVPHLCHPADGEMQDAVQRAIAGGKRIRGGLVCLVCAALGGDTEDAIPGALAVEYVQAASLLHDDFVDADRVRRHAPAGWVVDGARQAVLLADVMFASAIEQMVTLGSSEGAVIARAISATARGAYQEFQGRTRKRCGPVTASRQSRPESYDALIAQKTGALFGAAAQLGALAAGADESRAAAARVYGALLGEAYQIADDRADLFKGDGPIGDVLLSAVLLRQFMPGWREEALGGTARVGSVQGKSHLAPPPELARRMGQAIAHRNAQALAVLDTFPDGSFTRFLRELPAQILRPPAGDGP